MQIYSPSRTYQLRLSLLFVLLASLLWPLPATTPAIADEVAELDASRVRLKTLWGDVQWWSQRASGWQLVRTRDSVVQVGDQVRMGPEASARLIYSDGSQRVLEPGTTLWVCPPDGSRTEDLPASVVCETEKVPD